MKFQFTQKAYQTAAVDAVADCFAGQPKAEGVSYGKVKHIYFIAETKGSMSSLELRKIEEIRIECARKFFAKISSDQVKYEIVDNYGKLMELVG